MRFGPRSSRGCVCHRDTACDFSSFVEVVSRCFRRQKAFGANITGNAPKISQAENRVLVFSLRMTIDCGEPELLTGEFEFARLTTVWTPATCCVKGQCRASLAVDVVAPLWRGSGKTDRHSITFPLNVRRLSSLNVSD